LCDLISPTRESSVSPAGEEKWLGAKLAERILSLRFIADMSDSSNQNRYTAGPSQSRRVLLGLMVLVLVAIGGAVFWGNSRLEKESSRVTAVQSEAAQPSPAPQNDTKQAVTALEQAVKDLQSANQRAADQITDLQQSYLPKKATGSCWRIKLVPFPRA
jgi:uncharacterized protein HemX